MMHAERSTTYFSAWDDNSIQINCQPLDGMHALGPRELLNGTLQTSHTSFDQKIQRQNFLHDWIPHIFHSSVVEHRNQPAKNKTTGHPLRQVGSSLNTAPPVAVPAEKTSTQPYKPPPRSLSSTSSPKAHLRHCWKSAKEQRHHPGSQLHGENSLFLVLQGLVQRQWTVDNLKTCHQVEISFKIMASTFIQSFHHAHLGKKVLIDHGSESGLIRGDILLPLLYMQQRAAFLYLLQQEVDRPRQYSKTIYP